MPSGGHFPDHARGFLRRRALPLLLCLVALGACLSRDAFGQYLIPQWLAAVLQIPVIVTWVIHCFASVRQPAASRSTNLSLTIAAMVGAVAIASITRKIDPFFIAMTSFIAGMHLLDWIGLRFRRCEEMLCRPVGLLRSLLLPWVVMVFVGTILLAIPLATSPGVPDYRHNFWLHIANSAFTSVSAACLVGMSSYGFGEDYSLFGQVVIYLQTQLAGMMFAATGLSAVRPFLRHAPSLGLVLRLSVGVQLVGAAVMWNAWSDSDVASAEARTGWSLLHAASAFWNSGWTQRSDGFAQYLSHPGLFAATTLLAIIGSLGLPVLLDLIRSSSGKSEVTSAGIPAWKRLPQWEASAALILLVLTAGAIFVVETPRFLPGVLVPERPVDFGTGRVSIRDQMPHQSRWTMAVFVSATIRSAGLQSLPVSEGAISWPAYVLMLVLMALGGSVAGTAGGIHVSTLLVIMLALFCTRLTWTQHFGGQAARRMLCRNALMIVSVCVALQIAAAYCLAATTEGTPYEVIFDSVAAVSNVGLSTGLALHLTWLGKLTMMLTMIVGRFLPLYLWLGTSKALIALTAPVAEPASRME